jgi:adenylate cyclase
MPRRPWLTLGRLLGLAIAAVALPAGITFYVFFESSQQSILARSETLRQRAAQQIDEELTADLGVAADSLQDVERAVRFGALDPSDPAAIEARLFSELLDHPSLSDLSFTHAVITGSAPDGKALLEPGDRWQVAAFRSSADPDAAIATRRTLRRAGVFATDVRRREPGAPLSSGTLERQSPSSDPTEHDTFTVTAARDNYGRAIWSDLSFSDLDAALPLADRRVVVTVQKAIEAAPQGFVGVLRVGLQTRTIDSLPRRRSTDVERVFLCDADGRLVARLDPGDSIGAVGDDLRVVPTRVPPAIGAALTRVGRSGPLCAAGVDYLVTFRPLRNSQGWMVGVVAPEAAYTGDLRTLRDRFVVGLLVVIAAVVAGGWLIVRQVRHSLGRAIDVTKRMRGFDFEATPVSSPLREVADVMDGVERAKTSVRALGKYVSVDLVRELYAANRDPELGGALVDLSLMFTDMEGFTSLSERLAPDALARALGHYLAAMTRAVHSTGGTVDKYIGDAVMAFWNAPALCPDHARRACSAVLACLRATRELYASELWSGLPPLFTRFGVHTARVMVGHFGSPDHFSYTALGDGVNLAARLEPLCKQYGVGVLVSEATVQATAGTFGFRLIDKVAVKGKTQSVRVYELLGLAEECAARMPAVRAYEDALEAYFGREFHRALERLASSVEHDPPAAVLAERCKVMMARPPPEDWDGVWVAKSK